MIHQLAKMLGLCRDDAEASMHSERAARAVLTRRNLFAAGAAMAAGSAFSFGKAEPMSYLITNGLEVPTPTLTLPDPKRYNWEDIVLTFDGVEYKLPGLAVIEQRITNDGFRRTMRGPFGTTVTITEKRT